MSKKSKKVCTVLNYIEQSFTLISAFTGCVSIAAIKIYKSIIKKKRKKSTIVLLEVLISKASIVINLSHNEFVLVNDVLKNI